MQITTSKDAEVETVVLYAAQGLEGAFTGFLDTCMGSDHCTPRPGADSGNQMVFEPGCPRPIVAMEGCDSDRVFDQRNRIPRALPQHTPDLYDRSIHRPAEVVHATSDGRTASDDAEDDELHDGVHRSAVFQSAFWIVHLFHHVQLVGHYRTQDASQTQTGYVQA